MACFAPLATARRTPGFSRANLLCLRLRVAYTAGAMCNDAGDVGKRLFGSPAFAIPHHMDPLPLFLFLPTSAGNVGIATTTRAPNIIQSLILTSSFLPSFVLPIRILFRSSRTLAVARTNSCTNHSPSFTKHQTNVTRRNFTIEHKSRGPTEETERV